jgi:rfaE bifunctional protein nucleotidyltransferase chain/domain
MSPEIHPKLLKTDKLLHQRAIWRQQGKKVAFTNGCFDLLHAGHVHCLEAARSLADILVVGLNDDTSIRQLKGPGRPLQTLQDRIVVVGALSCVSWLTVFCDTSVESLVRQVLPDVLVKGGDYDVADVVGADAVQAAGGSVVITEHVQHTSTTDLLARLREVS